MSERQAGKSQGRAGGRGVEGKEEASEAIAREAGCCALACSNLGYRPAVTGRTAPSKELFMQGEIDHLGIY